jgi:hypothetical protein
MSLALLATLGPLIVQALKQSRKWRRQLTAEEIVARGGNLVAARDHRQYVDPAVSSRTGEPTSRRRVLRRAS